ncbi:hypothetical protein MJT46_016372 [Ovis ammon polii x Ovis aries]|nr:hypothetical protein MJT46_016372 [Ovis ammon polii x Ovis aries]
MSGKVDVFIDPASQSSQGCRLWVEHSSWVLVSCILSSSKPHCSLFLGIELGKRELKLLSRSQAQEAVKPVHSHFHVQRPSPLPEAALSFVVLIHLLILSRVQATDPLTKCLGQLRKSGLPDRAGAREKQTVPSLSSEHNREPKALASVSTPVPKSCLVGFPTTWAAAHIAPHCSPHTCEEGSVTFSIWGGIKDHNKPVQKPVGAPGASIVLTCLDVFTAPPPAACLQQRITTTQYGYFQGRFEVMTSHMGDDLTHG